MSLRILDASIATAYAAFRTNPSDPSLRSALYSSYSHRVSLYLKLGLHPLAFWDALRMNFLNPLSEKTKIQVIECLVAMSAFREAVFFARMFYKEVKGENEKERVRSLYVDAKRGIHQVHKVKCSESRLIYVPTRKLTWFQENLQLNEKENHDVIVRKFASGYTVVAKRPFKVDDIVVDDGVLFAAHDKARNLCCHCNHDLNGSRTFCCYRQCGDIYCSDKCRCTAEETYHRVLCCLKSVRAIESIVSIGHLPPKNIPLLMMKIIAHLRMTNASEILDFVRTKSWKCPDVLQFHPLQSMLLFYLLCDMNIVLNPQYDFWKLLVLQNTIRSKAHMSLHEAMLYSSFIPFCQHSCEPNAILVGDRLFAIHPIATAEKITISYTSFMEQSGEFMERDIEKKFLQRMYGIKCRCQKCMDEEMAEDDMAFLTRVWEGKFELCT